MKEKYIPGGGCLCHAHSEAECGCDVDWTPREVYELREQRDMLAEALKEALAAIPDKTWVEDRLTFRKWERLIAAVKGGSDDN